MEAKRLEEIRARAELSRKRDWVVPREAIEDIDGLLEHIGELMRDNEELKSDIGIACNMYKTYRRERDELLQKLIGGSGE